MDVKIYNDVFFVLKTGKWGIIDRQGQWVSQPQFDVIGDFLFLVSEVLGEAYFAYHLEVYNHTTGETISDEDVNYDIKINNDKTRCTLQNENEGINSVFSIKLIRQATKCNDILFIYDGYGPNGNVYTLQVSPGCKKIVFQISGEEGELLYLFDVDKIY